MSTQTELVLDCLKEHFQNETFTSKEIYEKLSNELSNELSRQNVYAAISDLYIKHDALDRVKDPNTKMGFIYTLKTKLVSPKSKPEIVSPPKTRTRVQWTEEERMSMAVAFIKSPATYFKDQKNWQIIGHLQNSLPTSRWRSVAPVLDNPKWFDSYVDKALQAKREEKAREEIIDEVVPTIAPKVEQIAIPIVESVPSKIETSLQKEVAPTFDYLIENLMSRFATTFKESLIGVLKSPEIQELMNPKIQVTHTHIHKHENMPVNFQPQVDAVVGWSESPSIEKFEPKQTKPRIGVVTGNSSSITRMLEGLESKVDLVVTDSKNQIATNKVENCDVVMVMTRFISHSTSNSIKAAAKNRMVMVNGGGSELRRMINIWLKNNHPEIA